MSRLPDDFVLSNLSRRGFLKGASATGVLVLAATWGLPDAFAEEKKFGAEGMPHGAVDDPKVYVSIAADGSVTVICNRSEMGQGVRTSLSMVVADELDADWALVKVQQAPADEARFGNQDTDGSRSMRHWYEPMRRCGAAARTMLELAAAAQWKVPVSECRAQLHKVVHQPSGRELGYGELAAAASACQSRDATACASSSRRSSAISARKRAAPSMVQTSSTGARFSALMCILTACSMPSSRAAGLWRQGQIRGRQRSAESTGRGQGAADRRASVAL